MTISPAVQAALEGQLVQAIAIGGGIVIAAAAALGAWGVTILRKHLKIAENDRLAQTFENAIVYGLQKGATGVAQKVAAGGTKPQNLIAAIADEAHRYAAPKVASGPGSIMDRLGMDPSSLAERIAARLDPVSAEEQFTAALNLSQLRR